MGAYEEIGGYEIPSGETVFAVSTFLRVPIRIPLGSGNSYIIKLEGYDLKLGDSNQFKTTTGAGRNIEGFDYYRIKQQTTNTRIFAASGSAYGKTIDLGGSEVKTTEWNMVVDGTTGNALTKTIITETGAIISNGIGNEEKVTSKNESAYHYEIYDQATGLLNPSRRIAGGVVFSEPVDRAYLKVVVDDVCNLPQQIFFGGTSLTMRETSSGAGCNYVKAKIVVNSPIYEANFSLPWKGRVKLCVPITIRKNKKAIIDYNDSSSSNGGRSNKSLNSGSEIISVSEVINLRKLRDFQGLFDASEGEQALERVNWKWIEYPRFEDFMNSGIDYSLFKGGAMSADGKEYELHTEIRDNSGTVKDLVHHIKPGIINDLGLSVSGGSSTISNFQVVSLFEVTKDAKKLVTYAENSNYYSPIQDAKILFFYKHRQGVPWGFDSFDSLFEKRYKKKSRTVNASISSTPAGLLAGVPLSSSMTVNEETTHDTNGYKTPTIKNAESTIGGTIYKSEVLGLNGAGTSQTSTTMTRNLGGQGNSTHCISAKDLADKEGDIVSQSVVEIILDSSGNGRSTYMVPDSGTTIFIEKDQAYYLPA